MDTKKRTRSCARVCQQSGADPYYEQQIRRFFVSKIRARIPLHCRIEIRKPRLSTPAKPVVPTRADPANVPGALEAKGDTAAAAERTRSGELASKTPPKKLPPNVAGRRAWEPFISR
jgi:hypothetical protein